MFFTLKLFDLGCKKQREITPYEAPPKLQTSFKGLKTDVGCLLALISSCKRNDRALGSGKKHKSAFITQVSKIMIKNSFTICVRRELKFLNTEHISFLQQQSKF